ncbi:S-adenosyl-L-methionine-dependent methyltransferase [Coniella lustricola]|uniref:Protein-lysine N-methyltransferase EFM4 n=1 Tax=Coniella lustricola TaxID=2025994 RepID=A0A2T3AN96_9PEZI|nr:S-adenosyl-L-methionine-dependent methyltransferase [Coniella lustricola]
MATTNPSTTNSSKPTHLDPSELGTKEYWDSLYTTELTNHASNPADRGTVWFDDSDAEAKLVQFLEQQTTEPYSPLDQTTTSFLDLGCGNGNLLFTLREEGWMGRALGVDYSEQSIALAKQIAIRTAQEEQDKDDEEQEQQRSPSNQVEFVTWDVLQGPYDTVLSGAQANGWDVVLDKGTFDAISLSEEQRADGGRICEGYKARVVKLVRKGGLFIVTSCNWTEEELERWFGEGSNETKEGRFVLAGRVKYPSFSFGGVNGQTITTLCFQRTQ